MHPPRHRTTKRVEFDESHVPTGEMRRKMSKSLPGPLIIRDGKVRIADAHRDSEASDMLRLQSLPKPKAVQIRRVGRSRASNPSRIRSKSTHTNRTRRAGRLKSIEEKPSASKRSHSARPPKRPGNSSLIKAAVELALENRRRSKEEADVDEADVMPATLKRIKASGSLKSVNSISQVFDAQTDQKHHTSPAAATSPPAFATSPPAFATSPSAFATSSPKAGAFATSPPPPPPPSHLLVQPVAPTTVSEMCSLLRLEQYAHSFEQDEIELSDLPFLTRDELQEIVTNFEDLERLMHFISNMCCPRR